MADTGALALAFVALSLGAATYLAWLVAQRHGGKAEPEREEEEEEEEEERQERLGPRESDGDNELALRDAAHPRDGGRATADEEDWMEAQQERESRLDRENSARGSWPWGAAALRSAFQVPWTRRTVLPRSILLVSFLNSFVMSFPMNFFGKFITQEIGMTPTQFQQYYALTFLPFSFKPLYAFIFENWALCGSRRRGYLVACNLMIAACMFLMATVAREVWQVFLIGFAQNTFEAASGMVVGLVVIDVASKDRRMVPRLQAEQTMARYCGTFTALLLALPVSGCVGYLWDNRAALLVSAAIPAVSALVALRLPEPGAATAGDGTPSGRRAQGFSALEQKALVLFVPTIVLFEVLAICIGVHGNLKAAGKLDVWRVLVASSAATLVGYVLIAVTVMARTGSSATLKTLLYISIPCLYLFIVDAVPTSLDVISSYKYSTFSQCELQGLSLSSTLAQIAGMSLFGAIFVGWRVEETVLLTTIVTAVFGLLDLLKTRGDLALPRFAVWALVDVSSGIFSAMFLLAKETIATHFSFLFQDVAKAAASSASDHLNDSVDLTSRQPRGPPAVFSPGILYSIYLTCFDIGGSASGFLSAALISSLGIVAPGYAGLNEMILICAVAFIATSALVPTIRFTNMGGMRN